MSIITLILAGIVAFGASLYHVFGNFCDTFRHD